jgi:hypothetical protein
MPIRLPSSRTFKSPRTLRKEFGSQINLKHGLYSASRELRHGNIEVTAQGYVDKRERAGIGLGHLLKAKEQSIIPMQPQAADSIRHSFEEFPVFWTVSGGLRDTSRGLG